MTQIPNITKMAVNFHVSLWSLFLLLACAFPEFLEFTLPMSVIIAIFLTFMRMAGDNEIIILKSSGASLYRMLPPVVLFCLIGYLAGIGMTIWVAPESRVLFNKKSLEFAQSNLEVGLQERRFITEFDNVMLYVSSADVNNRQLKDILIQDRQTQEMTRITTAPSGVLVRDKAKAAYTLRLFNGKINQVSMSGKSVNTIAFQSYDINLDLMGHKYAPNHLAKDVDELSLNALRDYILEIQGDKQKLRKALTELYKKYALPFVCVSGGLLAFALGIQSVSLNKSAGFGMGLIFFMIYYALMALGLVLGEKGGCTPALAVWFPNFIVGGAGIFFIVRNARETPVTFSMTLFKKLLRRINRFKSIG